MDVVRLDDAVSGFARWLLSGCLAVNAKIPRPANAWRQPFLPISILDMPASEESLDDIVLSRTTSGVEPTKDAVRRVGGAEASPGHVCLSSEDVNAVGVKRQKYWTRPCVTCRLVCWFASLPILVDGGNGTCVLGSKRARKTVLKLKSSTESFGGSISALMSGACGAPSKKERLSQQVRLHSV